MDRCDNCFRIGVELMEANVRIAILESTLKALADQQSTTERDQNPGK